MKKITLLLLLMLLCVSAAEAKFTYWGYSNKTVASAFGSGTKGKAAIFIPAEVAKHYVGLQVTGVRVGLSANADELTTFVSRDLNAEPIATKRQANSFSGLNGVTKFDTPYTITGEGFYVGYEYSGDKTAIGCSSVANVSGNGNWTNTGSGWVNNGTGAKALNIQARIEGDDIPFDMNIVEVQDIAVKENTPFVITGTLVNQSATKIYGYKLAYSVDGGAEKTVDFDATVGERTETTFNIDAEGLSGKGQHELNVRFVSADDQTDVYEGNNTYKSSLLITNISAVKRVLMEEFTGLMCGWCPRGIASIEACQEAFPDNFIAIAKHNYYQSTPEELKSPTYDYDADGNTTWPYCVLDRIAGFDPVPSETMAKVQTLISLGTGAALDVKASFVPGDDSRINARATAQFLKSNNESNYRFAFAILEDGVTGYQQNNNYSGGEYGTMGGFESKPHMTNVTLNHVARAGFSVKDGIENSVPTSVSEFSPVVYDMVLDVPSNVKDRKNLKVVAILLNKMNGTIENAAEVAVGEDGEAAIADINSTASPDVTVVDGKAVAEGFDGELQVMTLDGKHVANANLQHAIYIVKGNNGKQLFAKKIAL